MKNFKVIFMIKYKVKNLHYQVQNIFLTMPFITKLLGSELYDQVQTESKSNSQKASPNHALSTFWELRTFRKWGSEAVVWVSWWYFINLVLIANNTHQQ